MTDLDTGEAKTPSWLIVHLPVILLSVVVHVALLFLALRATDQSIVYAFVVGISASLATFVGLSLFISSAPRRWVFLASLINSVLMVLIYAILYKKFGLIYVGEAHVESYTIWDNLYFSIVTLTTLGYGDYQPPQSLRLLAGIQALTGYAYLGFLVSATSSWMIDIRQKMP